MTAATPKKKAACTPRSPRLGSPTGRSTWRPGDEPDMKSGEFFQVEIESLDQEGRGVGHREGKAVFVEGALPGERATYERRRNKASYEVGRTVAIERVSSLRATPRCPHFGLGAGSCGGCSMQHLDARAQVAIKQRVLEDSLWHIGRLRAERMLRPIAGPTWTYRYRARLTVRDVAKKGEVLVGFHERASSFVADMTRCEVLPVRVSDLLVPLRRLVGVAVAARPAAADRTGRGGPDRWPADRAGPARAAGADGGRSVPTARVCGSACRRVLAAARRTAHGGAVIDAATVGIAARIAGVRSDAAIQSNRLHPG